MRCLTLRQPWATLVAIGAKTIETRSWAPGYTGPIAIHAAKRMDDWERDICRAEPFQTALAQAGLMTPADLPLGAIVAIAELRECLSTEWQWSNLPPPADSWEYAFGDYSPGRWMWMLEDVRALREPIPARGTLGLWSWQPPAGLVVPR